MTRLDPWVWLGGSLLLAVATTQASWGLRRWEKGCRFARSPAFPVLRQLACLVYYVGLPFAALIWGHDAVVGRLLGLKPLAVLSASAVPPAERLANWVDWAGDVGWTAGLGAAAWGVLALGWWAARRAGGLPELAGESPSVGRLLQEAAYQEVHWSFYRNAPAVALGTYWGTWIGLGLVALEAGLNPWWRNDLGSARQRSQRLMQAALALLSAVFYLETMNLWLAVLLHWGVAAGLRALAAIPVQSGPRPPRKG